MKSLIIFGTFLIIWSLVDCFPMNQLGLQDFKEKIFGSKQNDLLNIDNNHRNKRQAYQFPSGVEFFLPELRYDSFSCQQRPYGYYADMGNYCQVFHICHENGQQYSFFCPNQTIFDQKLLVCEEELQATPCEQAEQYYFVNQYFGYVGELPDFAVQIKSLPI